MPQKAQRDLFQLSSFPENFFENIISKTNNPHPMLNKVEQFLLKLTIPFLRVAHCERGPQILRQSLETRTKTLLQVEEEASL